MGGDVAPCPGPGVARHTRERADERRERGAHAVEARHLARTDANQSDEVVAVPAAVRVQLGEWPAAAAERPPEGWIVNGDGGAEVCVRRAELSPPAVGLDYLEPAGAQSSQGC